MKRHARLRPLSDEHHAALVLGRRMRRAVDASGAALLKAWAELAARFAAELEPHFRIEEAWLFPDLDEAGERALADGARADHDALRALVRGVASAEAARAFADRIEQHVRFEERELFPRVEALLAARADTDPGRLAGDVRDALIDAALASYDDAAQSGLCREGAFEAAVGAMRALALEPLLARPRRRC